jgi:4-amino-4-deoxychorismate lyase
MLYCAIDGKQIHSISCLDRGLAYGDGVFTTAKIVAGKIELFAAHIQRLKSSCARLAINYQNFADLEQQVTEVAQQFSLAVLKIIITAGVGGRGYSRQGTSAPLCIISVFDYPRHYIRWQKQGITLGDATFQLGINPALSGIKHLNRLEQVLIRQELDQREEDDLLVTDINHQLIETSCANLFWLDDNGWHTPALSNAGIAGIMRNYLLKQIPQVTINTINLSQFNANIAKINALFMCNSVMGIVPITTYNKYSFSIDTVKQLCQQLNLRELSVNA